MAFKPRNAYYLRISSNIILPLYLYLDERHIDWMSDVILQRVLADLRPLIIPKLHTEKDIHFGPGAAPGNKRGTVEVHRGETYQFAYFFRKTESHTVLFKSRHFVTAPPRPQVAPVQASAPSRPHRNTSKKRARSQVTPKRGDRKRAKTKGKSKASQSHLDDDEEEWSGEESEEDSDVDDSPVIARQPRPRRRRRANTYREDEDEDVAMGSPQSDAEQESSSSTNRPAVPENDEDIMENEGNDQQSLPRDTPDIDLTVEEEETKPKPLLKLRYQSFPISGHCLCVVVEPWPPQRTVAQLQPQGLLGTASRQAKHPPDVSEPVVAGQRAKTPLFFPEYDRAPSEAPFARERAIPPPPLFSDDLLTMENDDHDDLMDFSQLLNSAGHMHANAADDDDDMDGAVLFGDADETRELL